MTSLRLWRIFIAWGSPIRLDSLITEMRHGESTDILVVTTIRGWTWHIRRLGRYLIGVAR